MFSYSSENILGNGNRDCKTHAKYFNLITINYLTSWLELYHYLLNSDRIKFGSIFMLLKMCLKN